MRCYATPKSFAPISVATMLEIDGLDHSYGRHRALARRLDPRRCGEVVAILGANGAGKTTLLNAIAGPVASPLAARSASAATSDRSFRSQIVERGIATVTETRHLFGPLSVVENLSLGAFTHAHGRRRTPDDAACSSCSRGSPSGDAKR